MYCQTGTDQEVNASLKHLLSTSVRPPWQWHDVNVFNVNPFSTTHYSNFWRSIRCLEVNGNSEKCITERVLLALKCAKGLVMIPLRSLAK